MLPATFLEPWEAVEIDFQDMKISSETGNRYLLGVANKASKCLFAYPTKTEEELGAAQHSRCFRVKMYTGPANPSRAQGAVERAGA